MRDKVPDLVWEDVEWKEDIDTDDLKRSTQVKREVRKGGWIKTKYPSGEVREVINDWIEGKAEKHLEKERPGLPDENEVREETKKSYPPWRTSSSQI